MSISQEERKRYSDLIKHKLRAENVYTKLWSLLHHGFVFAAATLSACSAAVLQIKTYTFIPDAHRTDIATLLALLATLLGSVAASGAFTAKWRANRAFKSALEQIDIMLRRDDCDLDKVVEVLQKALADKELVILAESGK